MIFEDRLDNSLQRDLMKIEHVRMRLPHEPINADLFDMELIELKFIFDRRMFLYRMPVLILADSPRRGSSSSRQPRLQHPR